MMTRTILLSFLLLFTLNLLFAQENPSGVAPSREVRYKSPLEAEIAKETNEVEHFDKNLQMLRTAFEQRDISNIVDRERAILEAMRTETQQLEDKVAGEVQPETQKRFEKMRHTMADFDNHSFDPGKPQDAARDFAKLDDFLQLMREELAELQK